MCFYFFDSFIFSWMIIAVQHWVGFCNTSTWISRRYAYVPSLLNLPRTSRSSPPLQVATEHGVWAPSNMQQVPTGYLFYMWSCICSCHSLHLNVSLSFKVEMSDFSLHFVFPKSFSFFFLCAVYSIYVSMLISTRNISVYPFCIQQKPSSGGLKVWG